MPEIDDILKMPGSPEGGMSGEFERAAMEVFRRQAGVGVGGGSAGGGNSGQGACRPYRDYLDAAGIDPAAVVSVDEIPYLPIELFKTHKVYCGDGGQDAERGANGADGTEWGARKPEAVFTSSSTGGEGAARHYVARLADYEKIYTRGFELFYGAPADWSIYALLPSYLEREGSSLVYMAEGLMRQGRKTGTGGAGRTDGCGCEKKGGFYLYDHEKLLHDMVADDGKKMLLGVSYALLDFAGMVAARGEKLPGAESGETIVVETGGMKGRREDMSKADMHAVLMRDFGFGGGVGFDRIHSEYGMAELMSQAWSCGDGVFRTPPWMRVAVRDLADPFDVRGFEPGRTEMIGQDVEAQRTGRIGCDERKRKPVRGGINIMDLANLHSCAFIQTQDIGTLLPDGSFTVDGRVARSDIRGCNLLVQ